MVAGSLALAIALQGVELADASKVDLARLETQTVRAMWGPTRPGRAMEVIYSLVPQGHRTSRGMRTKYNKLALLARVARVPPATQVLPQAIWECREPPPPPPHQLSGLGAAGCTGHGVGAGRLLVAMGSHGAA